MTDAVERPQNCGACAFWRKLLENDGVCCHWAPEATNRPETVAHWPQTHAVEGCSDVVAAARFSVDAYCANRQHWRPPEHALNPINRGDMP